MTREQAIKVCTREKECVQSALDVCADGGHYVSPDGIITAMDYVEAMDMAIAALREQEERGKGCEFCDNGEQYSTYDKYGMNLTLALCPMCGRRLEEV